MLRAERTWLPTLALLGALVSSAHAQTPPVAASTTPPAAAAQAPAGAAAAPSPAGDHDPHDGHDHDGHDHAGHDHDGHDHGGAQAGGPAGDFSREDANLPVGSVLARIVDAKGNPLPGVEVTLGVLENSVAKGESRRREFATSDAQGQVRWDHLPTTTDFAYRVSVSRDGATFALMPFRLGTGQGTLAELHVYPVSHDVEAALVVTQSALMLEVKDDLVQLEQAVAIYNFGETAWLPVDLVLPMPAELKAFNTERSMSDVTVEKVDGGVRIRGTFTPGQHQLDFRWQLPYSGQTSFAFDVGLPPHTASARVVAVAAQTMRMQVDGFGEARPRDWQGQRLLEVQRELRRNEPALRALSVRLDNIPEPGLPKWLLHAGVALAALLALGGALFAWREKPASEKVLRQEERERILDELSALQRARAAGEVGPKSYDKIYRELVDRLALVSA